MRLVQAAHHAAAMATFAHLIPSDARRLQEGLHAQKRQPALALLDQVADLHSERDEPHTVGVGLTLGGRAYVAMLLVGGAARCIEGVEEAVQRRDEREHQPRPGGRDIVGLDLDRLHSHPFRGLQHVRRAPPLERPHDHSAPSRSSAPSRAPQSSDARALPRWASAVHFWQVRTDELDPNAPQDVPLLSIPRDDFKLRPETSELMVSFKVTSHHLAPPRTTSHHLTSPHTTSHHLTPPHTTSHHLAPPPPARPSQG